MEINVKNFFGIDLTNEPNDHWIGYNKSDSDTCTRRKRRNAKFEMCMADTKKHNIVIVFSNRVKNDYLELVKLLNPTDEFEGKKLSITKDGFEFFTLRELVQFSMLIIQKL